MTAKTTKRERQRAAAEARAATRLKQQQRRTLGRVLGGLGLAAAIVVGFLAVRSDEGAGPAPAGAVTVSGPPRAEPLGPGEAIPQFTAPALAGGRVVWSDYLGKPAVLSVWAPWCPHCQAELPILDRVMKEFPDVPLVTIVTAIGDQPGPTPEGYLAEHGLTFPTAIDDDADTLASAFGIDGFPTLYFVNSDGMVARHASGELPEEQIRETVAALA